MRRSSSSLFFSLVLLASLLSSGCGSTSSASVRCGDFGRVESDFGVVNIPQFALGTILAVDPQQKTVYRLLTVVPPDAATHQTNPELEKASIVKNSNFSVELGADIPETVKAQVKSSINASTEFVLKNQRRKEVLDPLGQINASATALERIKAIPSTQLVVYVQALQFADALDIRLQRGSSASADVDVLKYGKYKFNVAYDCKQTVSNLAPKGGAMFWKYSIVKYDAAKNQVFFDSRAFSPSEINWMPGIL